MPAAVSRKGTRSDPQDHVTMLLTLMQALQGVMEAENQLLRELRLSRLCELQGEKAALIEGYVDLLRELRHSPSAMTELGVDERTLLDTALRTLPAAIRRNANRLTQAREAIDHVAHAIDESLGSTRRGCGAVLRPKLASSG